MPTNEPWIIYALAFGAVLLGVQGSFLFLSLRHREQKAINRRLALGQRLGSSTEVLETLRRERGLGLAGGVRALEGLEELVLQTGLRVDPLRLVFATLGLTVLYTIVFSFSFGTSILVVVLALIVAVATVYLVLQVLRRRRIERFGEQFPDALQVIVRGLRAGHPFRVAMSLVAREMPDPIGSEFGILVDEIGFGLDLNTAVDSVVRRVGHDDLAFFAVAVNIQSQTGGNLAEILSRLAGLMRNRAKLRLKVRALTSEGRLSAIFLSFAPFILFSVISLLSPSYFADIRHHPILVPAITVGLMMLGIGNVIMYRMVNFKV